MSAKRQRPSLKRSFKRDGGDYAKAVPGPKAWTDYPILELGDVGGQPAPVRECEVLSYDGNRYCRIVVGGVTTEIKSGYLYSAPGRCGEVPHLTADVLRGLGAQ